jgi:type III pantothenate kinase
MKPDVVVDIGNTRIKWGKCSADAVTAGVALPGDDRAAWEKQTRAWEIDGHRLWTVAGVQPAWRARLVDWLKSAGHSVATVDQWEQLPLRVRLQEPGRVGLDRLFNAVAANSRRIRGSAAVIVDAGSAVTVDYVDGEGAFRGGAILPGFRLMAHALHDYTALLPLVKMPEILPVAPADSTVCAMQAGIYWAVAGAAILLVQQMKRHAGVMPQLFVTGGDGSRLLPALRQDSDLREVDIVFWPEMTLEGIRRTAAAMP